MTLIALFYHQSTACVTNEDVDKNFAASKPSQKRGDERSISKVCLMVPRHSAPSRRSVHPINYRPYGETHRRKLTRVACQRNLTRPM